MITGLLAALALWLAGAGGLSAIPGGRDFGRTVPDVRPLEEGEAASVLAEFRASRGGPDSVLEGDLIHFPRRAEEREWPVTVRTGWAGGVLRLRIDFGGEGAAGPFLFRGGADPAGWKVAPGTDGAVRLDGAAMLEPLIPGVELTAFDLTAPYLDWPDFRYEESVRVSGSPAHWFRFEPPPGWAPLLAEKGIAAVRVALDTRFNAPIRAEYVGPDGEPARILEARSFKKFANTWIVRRLEAFDAATRDRSELRIEDALVEIRLPGSVFRPEGLSEPAPAADRP